MNRLYTAAEAAEKLNVPAVTIQDWTRKRMLGCIKIGSRNIRISQEQIDEFLKSRTQERLDPTMKDE